MENNNPLQGDANTTVLTEHHPPTHIDEVEPMNPELLSIASSPNDIYFGLGVLTGIPNYQIKKIRDDFRLLQVKKTLQDAQLNNSANTSTTVTN